MPKVPCDGSGARSATKRRGSSGASRMNFGGRPRGAGARNLPVKSSERPEGRDDEAEIQRTHSRFAIDQLTTSCLACGDALVAFHRGGVSHGTKGRQRCAVLRPAQLAAGVRPS